MKLKNILSGVALFAIAGSAMADVTIELTGATAFRAAANEGILTAFAEGGTLGTTWNYAHSAASGSLNTANRAVFVGTFPGIDGTTTIKTSWNGSTEGIRAVALGDVTPAYQPTFLPTGAITVAGENHSKSGGETAAHPKFSFSDVLQTSSPVLSPVLEPADAKVGVVSFSFMANEGAGTTALTNITPQAFRALFTAGRQRLWMFTGNPADTAWVYATGRNDGSGTRTTYLAETGYGISNVVNQYTALTRLGDTITSIQRVPAGGVNDSDPGTAGIQPYPGQSATNASTLWGNDLDGNGGYASSSTNRDDMARTTASVTVRAANYTSTLQTGAQIYMVCMASSTDVANARVGGAKVLSYNGVKLTSLETALVLDAADIAKIANGTYTLWSYQQLYYRGTLSTDEDTFYTKLKTELENSVTTTGNGVPLSAMNVSRSDDGGTVAP